VKRRSLAPKERSDSENADGARWLKGWVSEGRVRYSGLNVLQVGDYVTMYIPLQPLLSLLVRGLILCWFGGCWDGGEGSWRHPVTRPLPPSQITRARARDCGLIYESYGNNPKNSKYNLVPIIPAVCVLYTLCLCLYQSVADPRGGIGLIPPPLSFYILLLVRNTSYIQRYVSLRIYVGYIIITLLDKFLDHPWYQFVVLIGFCFFYRIFLFQLLFLFLF